MTQLSPVYRPHCLYLLKRLLCQSAVTQLSPVGGGTADAASQITGGVAGELVMKHEVLLLEQDSALIFTLSLTVLFKEI
jgi:hypothetical protein